MINPIGNLSPPIVSHVSSQTEQTAKQLKEHIDAFADSLQRLLADPSLSRDLSFQKQFQTHILSLSEVVEKINPR